MFNGIKERLKEYVDTKLQFYQLTLEEKMFDFVTLLLYIFLLGGLLFVTLSFILLFLAKIINVLTNNQFAGYGIVASLCLILLWLLGRKESRIKITGEIKKLIISNIKSNSDGI